jgi:hypothetical protein
VALQVVLMLEKVTTAHADEGDDGLKPYSAFKKSMQRRRPLSGRSEKVIHRNFQNIGDDLQSLDADMVGAVLVFLHLLEGYAQSIGEFLLR